MSRMYPGFDNRIFISGSKLWPPERIFTSSLCSDRYFTASLERAWSVVLKGTGDHD